MKCLHFPSTFRPSSRPPAASGADVESFSLSMSTRMETLKLEKPPALNRRLIQVVRHLRSGLAVLTASDAGYLVSVRKGCFSALAASICGLACAAYGRTPPRNPLIPCQDKKSPLSESETVVSHPEFPDGNYLAFSYSITILSATMFPCLIVSGAVTALVPGLAV